MKLSNRLLACAEMISPGSIVADVGTDHGHLPIYLIENHICRRVLACDLRPGPLSAARENATLAGVQECISFYLSDGLCAVPLEDVTSVVCSGMGGDTIRHILTECPDAWRENIQYIFQPQADVPELRRFLGENGFRIRKERFAQDGGFVYTVMEVRFSGGVPLTPGQSYLPQGQVNRCDPLYRRYMDRVINGLKKTVAGIQQGKNTDEVRLCFYQEALSELLQLEEFI